MKMLILMCGVFAGLIACAEPSVTSVTAQQRYPWNGLVDILVTLQGTAEEVSEYECYFAATNSATCTALPIVHIEQNGDVSGLGTTWTRRFVWDAAKDIGAVKIDDAALTVYAQLGVQLWENGPCWSKCNVGATKPEEYGHYFWWGDTVGYKRNAANNGWISVKDGSSFSFTEVNCPTYGMSAAQLQSAGYIDATGNLVAAHDAATTHLGAPWRMPTDAEFAALIDNCDTTWTTHNGVWGHLVAGRGVYASKSIFLPAAGVGYNSGLSGTGSVGYYWSSAPHLGIPDFACYLYFGSSHFRRYCYLRYGAQSVRPLRGFANGAISDLKSGVGGTTHLTLDCRTGTRMAAETETITYSIEWADGAGEGAMAVVSVNGEVISEQSGSGMVEWTPSRSGKGRGNNVLTHVIMRDGAQVGETLIATFNVNGGPYSEIIDGIEWTYMAQDGLAALGSGNSKGPTAVPKSTVGAIVTPSRIGGCGVSSIADYAFQGCDKLTAVTICEGIVCIGTAAFSGCDGLNAVDFEGGPPNGVADAGIKQNATIRYNMLYERVWLPVIEQCGWTNAMPYDPFPPIVTDVIAKQRYPWNGKVDIFYTVESACVEARELYVWAVDRMTGITNVAKNVTGDIAYTNGLHHIVWDMSEDELAFVSSNVVFFVSYGPSLPLYCVIDLSGDTSATSYPVTYLNEVPSGGWSDGYKTTKLVLRRISAGTFTMGSPTDELGRSSNETQHKVTLTKCYWMGVFPVTQRQWELVMGTRPSYFNNDAYYAPRPVEQVSYNMIRGSSAGAGWPNSSDVDATSFLGILQAKSGLALDLPTEAQWEYACRAGTTTALNSGKNLTNEYQDSEMDKVGRYWYNGWSGYSQSCDWSAGTAKVGSYAPNAWGLYDMHGNVWEWCLDWYGSYSGDATDPKGSSSGRIRVVRGGSWISNAYFCRSAYRYYYYPSGGSYDYGFRLVRTLSDIEEVKSKSEKGKSESAVAATSGGASVQGESVPVRVDLTPGTRTASKAEVITYSTAWNEVKERSEGGGVDAVAVVSVNGEVISEQSGSGAVVWVPSRGGTNVLAHIIMKDGAQVGETLTATFNVNGGPYTEIIDCIEWTYMAKDGNAALGSGNSEGPMAVPKMTAGAIVTPARIGGCVVSGIADYAFQGCDKLTSVTISDGIACIGTAAFSGCKGLTSVLIPSAVTIVGECAFYACSGLVAIDVESGNALYSSRDGVLFNKDKTLLIQCPSGKQGAYVVQSSVTEIGRWAFEGCVGLVCVTVPPSVERVGEGALSGCGAIDFELLPPDGIADAGIKKDAAIRYNIVYEAEWKPVIEQCGWTNAKPYLYPAGGPYKETVDSIEWTFMVDDDLNASVGTGEVGGTAISTETAGAVVVPETLGGRRVTGVGAYAFKDCTELTEVTLPTNVVTIGVNAFANVYCLDNVIIPDSVEEIGDGAFMNCTEMSAFEFGKGLKRIGNSAFENCISLESVVIQEGLTNLGARAFWGQSRLKSVSLPASLESIGADAFKGSTFITGVTVPTHLMTMQELFPDSYQKIESVVVPEGEGTIRDSMFAGCVGLKTIIIPSSVTNIGASAFANCSALVELGLPDEVTTLGAKAFYGCMALKTVSLPRNLTAIADETFAVCPMLDSLVIPASVTSLGHKIYSGARIGYYFTANLTAVNFLGDAPGTYSDSYEGMPSALKSYVIKGSRSWYMPGSPTLPPNGWPTTGNARDITYWTPNEFEVTFDGNGGTPETYVSKQITDTTYSLPKSDPVRDGYLFQGWWTEKEAGAQIYWNTRVTATKAHTLYAHWKSLVEMITVRFNPNGGTVEPSEKTYPPGVTFGELPVPTRIGHNFVGWYTSQVGGDLVTESTVVSKEHNELYAHWEPITYRVAFDANGGQGTMYDQTHTYNVSQALTANAYYLTGFNFTGWSETRGGVVKYANQQVVENLAEIQGQVVTLYAVWSGAKYSVRFDANGGEGIMANQTHQVGVRLALSKCTFTRKGYSFLGWATTPKGVVEYEDEEEVQNLTMQASATVPLYAVWSPNPYSIAYDANGGMGTMAPTACLYDKEATIPACGFSKDGYSFTGWATSAEGAVIYTPGQKVLNLTDEAGKVITLFAVWELAGVEAPVFSPKDGTVFKGSCTVTLTCPTPGASIYYRIGAKPKATSKYLYSAPFEITETSTVYAFAKLGDTESECVTATYTKGKVITFEEAVKAKGITAFTHGGDAVWGVEEGLGEGDVCVRSGVIIDEQVSWFETTVQGPGTISFKWKASCEEDYPSHEWDHLAFNIDGAKDDYARLDGVTDWEEVSVKLEAGTHTLRWSYVKDESDAEGEDCGWVDCVTWVADAPAPVPPGGEIDVPKGKTAKEFADEVNKNKAQYLKWPLEGPVSTDYLGYFTAVPKGDAKVEFVLNEEGTNEVVKATTTVKTAALDVVFSEGSTLKIDEPLVGFYYSLRQGGDLSVGAKADLNKLGGRDEISFELTKGPFQYFYQTLVTPTPQK